MALQPPPKALLFDVFGTCVDWRSTVTRELEAQSHAALDSATASLASRVRLRASDMTTHLWGDFAQQWRNSYKIFTKLFAADPNMAWKTIDEHHLDSLKELLKEWELEGLWKEEEVLDLSLVWHRLDPWADSSAGIQRLSQSFCTAPLARSPFNSRECNTQTSNTASLKEIEYQLTSCSDCYAIQRQRITATRSEDTCKIAFHAYLQCRAVRLVQAFPEGLPRRGGQTGSAAGGLRYGCGASGRPSCSKGSWAADYLRGETGRGRLVHGHGGEGEGCGLGGSLGEPGRGKQWIYNCSGEARHLSASHRTSTTRPSRTGDLGVMRGASRLMLHPRGYGTSIDMWHRADTLRGPPLLRYAVELIARA